MPPIKPITVTVKTEATIAILAYLKQVRKLASDRAIDLALRKYFDEL